jgi:hypothetical protein
MWIRSVNYSIMTLSNSEWYGVKFIPRIKCSYTISPIAYRFLPRLLWYLKKIVFLYTSVCVLAWTFNYFQFKLQYIFQFLVLSLCSKMLRSIHTYQWHVTSTFNYFQFKLQYIFQFLVLSLCSKMLRSIHTYQWHVTSTFNYFQFKLQYIFQFLVLSLYSKMLRSLISDMSLQPQCCSFIQFSAWHSHISMVNQFCISQLPFLKLRLCFLLRNHHITFRQKKK